jgi:hypothetical protein
MRHTAIVTGGGRPKGDRLKWTNTGLANIKSNVSPVSLPEPRPSLSIELAPMERGQIVT